MKTAPGMMTVGELIAENAELRAELAIARAELGLRESYEHRLKSMLSSFTQSGESTAAAQALTPIGDC